MESYILIALCILVICIMCFQLYRTYTWQRLLDKKQAEFIEKPHVHVDTKAIYAPLSLSMCCLLLVFVNPMNLTSSKESLDAAIYETSSIAKGFSDETNSENDSWDKATVNDVSKPVASGSALSLDFKALDLTALSIQI